MHKPNIEDLYRGYDETVYISIPNRTHLSDLFTNFNEMARIGFTAHSSNSPAINQTIFYFGLDGGNTFTMHYDVLRWNVVVMVYIWASKLMNRNVDSFCTKEAQDFVTAFFRAWKEEISLAPDCTFRQKFLKIWQASNLDFIEFHNNIHTNMHKVIRKLFDKKPPLNIDSAHFILACKSGNITDADFDIYGPSMAFHFASVMHVRSQKNYDGTIEREKKRKRGEQELAELARTARRLRCADTCDDSDDEEDVPVEFEDDEMDLDEVGLSGIDITRLDWEGEVLKTLLSVDRSIVAPKRKYRAVENGRRCFVDPKKAIQIVEDEDDTFNDMADTFASKIVLKD